MDSRAYVKRIWRVPVSRGPAEYFATLVIKLMVKHGWPAVWYPSDLPGYDAFHIGTHKSVIGPPGQDFWDAAETAVRIVARTYRVQVLQHGNFVEILRPYQITKGRQFKEVKV